MDHLVIIVHGIRDRNVSWHSVKDELEQVGLAVEFAHWSPYFDVFRFLIPGPWLRRRAMRRLEKRIQDAITYHKPKRVSYIAHSFGTYLLCHLLRREHYLQNTCRLILCGSVLPHSFRFPSFMERYDPPVINDIGSDDRWPLIAKCVSFGYGAIGTYGYGGAPVHDRFHAGVGHDDFAKPGFCTKFWVPFLQAHGREGVVAGSKPPAPGGLQNTAIWMLEHAKFAAIFLILWFAVPAAIETGCRQHAVGEVDRDGARPLYFLNNVVVQTIDRIKWEKASKCSSLPSGWPELPAVISQGSDLSKLWACRGSPPQDVARPFGMQTLDDLKRQFPACITVTKSARALEVRVNRESGRIREVPLNSSMGSWLLCDCEEQWDERVRQLQVGPTR